MKYYLIRYQDEGGKLVWGYVKAPDHRSGYLLASRLFSGRLATFEPRPVSTEKRKPNYPIHEEQ